MNKTNKKIKEQAYFINGMHCPSCELIVEKKLIKLNNIKSVDASLKNNRVVIEYINAKPSINQLNNLFRSEKYVFSDKINIIKEEKSPKNNFAAVFGPALAIIVVFLLLNRLGLSGIFNVDSKSSLFAFLALGLVAGISSCAALVGGVVLSMSKQWMEIYNRDDSTFKKLQPHLMFNIGRLISYGALGFVLGLIGSRLQISLKFTSLLIVVISILMIFLGLQMLGVRTLRRFSFALPKSVSRYVANENNFKSRYAPFIMGALTFFLPCGFTITAQGLALVSGNPIQAGLIMLFFVLGTTPALLLIGLSSIKFLSKSNWAVRFSRVAGALILFFALFNINNQMNVMGFSSFSDLWGKQDYSNGASNDKDLPEIINDKQVIKMSASSFSYTPNYFKVRVGVPVRWEITNVGTSGCTNAVISKGLFDGSIDLSLSKVAVKEFTPTKAGKYKFSCWMGMVSGIIEVVDIKTSFAPSGALAQGDDSIVESGARGCGGGSGGGGCGCGGGTR